MKIRSDNELVSSSSEESDKEQEKGSNVADTRDNNKTNSNNCNSSENESEESDNESEDESKPGNTQNNINNIKEHSGENKDRLFHSNGKIASTEIDKSESSNSSHKINVPLTNGNKLKHKLDSNNDTLDGKDYTRPPKKLNSNVSTKYVTTSVHFKPLSVYKNQKKNGKSNKTENESNSNGNIYNRRINPKEVEFLDERLKDNSFLAKDGAIDSYGYKAHNDLFATRGKDFRAQKTKKKRGSYRGGKIDFESHSIKFAVDD
ncbi:unnamed protein product [Rhizophagus irregularis]|nr:unnamed protein product [Rhizophagus irregularis]